ncbi:hypothetical protein VTJ04DRAFT_6804 [Mycothermus thermophilus]|uniref:uncharacterized protein n=1 Tax=Humicola insolens TaxID=85995 RepID=UPI0037434327
MASLSSPVLIKSLPTRQQLNSDLDTVTSRSHILGFGHASRGQLDLATHTEKSSLIGHHADHTWGRVSELPEPHL